MKVVKDLMRRTRSEGRMDADNRWWVAELLAADCEKAWLHPGEEETMPKWYVWLGMEKEDEKRKMEELHQQRVNQMIKSAEGSAGLWHKITKPTAWRGGAQISKKEEEDVRLLDRCEAKRKEWAMLWQCDESVQNMEDKLWKNEELKKLERALPRLRECDLEKASMLYKAKTEVGGLNERKKQEEKWWSFWRRWSRVEKWPQQACTKMFFLIQKNPTSEMPISLLPDVDALVGLRRWRSGSRNIAWIGTLLMAEMEEELSLQELSDR